MRYYHAMTKRAGNAHSLKHCHFRRPRVVHALFVRA